MCRYSMYLAKNVLMNVKNVIVMTEEEAIAFFRLVLTGEDDIEKLAKIVNKDKEEFRKWIGLGGVTLSNG